MKKWFSALSIIALAFLCQRTNAQTFTFECKCEFVSGVDCDVCNATIQSRYFSGLYIKKNGAFFKLIDAPYIVKIQGTSAVITEIIPNPETVTIAMSGTAYTDLDSFKMALDCRCNDLDTTALWHPSDSLNVGSIYRGDTLMIVGRDAVSVVFDSILNKYVISATSGVDQTLSNTSDATSHTVTLSGPNGSTQFVEGVGIGLGTTGTTLNGILTIANTGVITEVDGSTTNEAWTIDADDADTELITTQTVKFQGGGILVTDYIPGTDILSMVATEVDGSITNELQTYSHGGTTTYTNTLSGGGGSWSITGAGIAVISQTGGAVTVTATEVDGSTTNEIQTYSHSGTTSYTNTLSGGGGSFSINAGTGITVTQTAGAVTVTNAGVTTQEQVEDWVGALLDNTARIAFTYDDPTASITADIVANSVGNSFIRQGIARSVIGVTGNGTTNVADIQGTANQVLRVNSAGTALAFGQVIPASVLVAANNVVIGNIAGTNQSAQELTVANLYTLLGLSGTAGRNAYWSGTNTLSNSANWLWDNTNGRVTIIPQVAGLGAGTAALNILPPGAGSMASMEAIRSWGNINGNILSGLYNTNTSPTSNAIETISTGSGAAGDPILQFNIAGGSGGYTSMGLDNSDANKFKLSAAGATYPGNFVNSSFVITQDAVPLYGINNDAPTVTLDVSGRVRASTHFIGTGGQWAAGNIVFGTGAGTGPTLNVISGTGNGWYITFTTGTSPATGGVIFTATFPTPFPNGPSFTVFSSRSETTSNEISKFFVQVSNDTGIVFDSNGALTASTQYSIVFFTFGM